MRCFMAPSLHQARAAVVGVDDEAVRCLCCKNRTGVGQAVRESDGVVSCLRCASRRQVFPASLGQGCVEIVG